MSSRNRLLVGDDVTDQLLRTLPDKVYNNILRSALVAGANVFKAEMKRNAPVVSGDLVRSIRTTSRTNRRRGTISASAKAGGKKAPYAISVEFGTRAHKIVAPAGDGLSIQGRVYKSVDHPGGRPHAFARPAADSAYGRAIAAVRAKIRERLTKQGISTPAPMDRVEAE